MNRSESTTRRTLTRTFGMPRFFTMTLVCTVSPRSCWLSSRPWWRSVSTTSRRCQRPQRNRPHGQLLRGGPQGLCGCDLRGSLLDRGAPLLVRVISGGEADAPAEDARDGAVVRVDTAQPHATFNMVFRSAAASTAPPASAAPPAEADAALDAGAAPDAGAAREAAVER